MNTSRRRYLVSYDIRCPKRLRKVHKLCSQSAVRIQYSVFEAHVTHAELRQLKEKIRQLIDEAEDDVRIYGLHENYAIATLGPPPLLDGVQWLAASPHDGGDTHNS